MTLYAYAQSKLVRGSELTRRSNAKAKEELLVVPRLLLFGR
jgi:hypothetical protein